MKHDIERLISIARSWINTPWQHNQKTKGIGVDCVRFLEQVAIEYGVDIPPLPDHYSRLVENEAMLDYLSQHFRLVTQRGLQAGDVILFKPKGLFNHIGLATSPTTVIHACQPEGKVLEHNIDGIWAKMLKAGSIWELK